MYSDDNEEVIFTKAEIRAIIDELLSIARETEASQYDWNQPFVPAKPRRLARELEEKLKFEAIKNEHPRAEEREEAGL